MLSRLALTLRSLMRLKWSLLFIDVIVTKLCKIMTFYCERFIKAYHIHSLFHAYSIKVIERNFNNVFSHSFSTINNCTYQFECNQLELLFCRKVQLLQLLLIISKFLIKMSRAQILHINHVHTDNSRLSINNNQCESIID